MNLHSHVEVGTRLRHLSWLVLWSLLCVSSARGAQTAEPLRVVILHGAHMLLPGSIVQEKSVRETMIGGGSRSIEFYSESFDAARLSGSQFVGPFGTLLQENYRER